MNKKIFIFILFIQLSGLVQSQPLDKICEREPCEEKNDSTLRNVTNAMSHAANSVGRLSSLFKAVRSIGTSINYIADVAVDIADESTVDLFSAIKKDLSEMQTNRMSEETHDLITHKEIAKPDKAEAIGFGFEVERRTKNSFIIKWATPSKADWKLNITRHNPDKQEEIKIPLGTTFYKIENVNEGDIIDIAFFDGLWHDTFQYEHRDSEISTTSEPVATDSPSRFSFIVERSTDNSFIVRWRRRSGADWKLLIDGVRPWKQRKEIKIPYGTTFYKIKYVNEGDIIDVTFFDGSWHEGFRYHHQDSERSISSRSGATGSASSPGFEVERSTKNSVIIKLTTQSQANWKLNITRHNPNKQEEIKIPLDTTFYTIENVNEGDIIDIALFDGEWHDALPYKHRESQSSASSRSAATGSSKDNSFKVERSTDNSFIVKWTRASGADWKILIDPIVPYRQREEICIPHGTTFYKYENVNEGDIIDVTFFDGSWHEGFRYHHQDSEGSISSRLGAAGTAKDNSFKVERSTDNSLIVKSTRGSAANWKLLIDGVRPWKPREEISIPLGTTSYKIENVNKDDIIDVTFFDGSWHETFRHEP